ncbi:hypothetical protein EV424DRAFT_1542955 [Suillus variegatus]|nr:hypothetical protein EV424DRAFT_1542955 [Suillus variegatus]
MSCWDAEAGLKFPSRDLCRLELTKFVFPFINLCATSSTALALLEYLNKVVKMIMGWQLGLLDNDNLFEKFATHGSDISSDLMSPYGGMHISNYGWWKDQFDVLGFEMLDQITLDELIELSQAHARQTVGNMLLPDICSQRSGPNPLLNNLQTIWDDIQAFRIVLKHLAFLMSKAYQHPIKLDIDIIWYNEALVTWESGINDAQEDALLAKFPLAENMLLDCPLVVIDSRYRIILWYILDALTLWVQNDMFSVTLSMGDLLKESITNGKSGGWRTNRTNFYQTESLGLTPGCINIAPCWFQQGHEVGLHGSSSM